MASMPLPANYCPDFKEMSHDSKETSVCNGNGLKLLELRVYGETGLRIVNVEYCGKNLGQFTYVILLRSGLNGSSPTNSMLPCRRSSCSWLLIQHFTKF